MGRGPGDDGSTDCVKELDDRWSASSGRRSVPPGSRRVSHVTEHPRADRSSHQAASRPCCRVDGKRGRCQELQAAIA